MSKKTKATKSATSTKSLPITPIAFDLIGAVCQVSDDNGGSWGDYASIKTEDDASYALQLVNNTNTVRPYRIVDSRKVDVLVSRPEAPVLTPAEAVAATADLDHSREFLPPVEAPVTAKKTRTKKPAVKPTAEVQPAEVIIAVSTESNETVDLSPETTNVEETSMPAVTAEAPAKVKKTKTTASKKPATTPVKGGKTTKPTAPVKEKGGLSTSRIATLSVLKKAGKPITHDAIATATGKPKGNKLRELTAEGLVATTEQEGTRGYVYAITAAGKKALESAGK